MPKPSKESKHRRPDPRVFLPAAIFFCLSVIGTGCVKRSGASIQFGKPTPALDEPGVVGLSLAQIDGDNAIFQLLNASNQTIFLFSDRSPSDAGPANIFGAWVQCDVGGKQESFGDGYTHGLSELEPVKSAEKLVFKIATIPNINAKCKLSVVYFVDEKIVAILNERPLDVSPSEQKAIDSSKKVVDVNFEITKTNKSTLSSPD
jgi:hypothetical protein